MLINSSFSSFYRTTMILNYQFIYRIFNLYFLFGAIFELFRINFYLNKFKLTHKIHLLSYYYWIRGAIFEIKIKKGCIESQFLVLQLFNYEVI